jgi:C1A family cysteine protease
VATLFVVCCVAFVASKKPVDRDQAERLFDEYVAENQIVFKNNGSRQKRFSVFKKNLRRIKEISREDGSGAQLKLGPHALLTYEEFLAYRTGANTDADDLNSKAKRSLQGMAEVYGTRPPRVFDWRNKTGIIGPIRKQGLCGSCWAHAAAGILESHWALKYKVLPSLSPQQMVDCAPKPPCRACNGGSVTYAYKYLLSAGGSHTEASYPYVSAKTLQAGTCRTFGDSIGAKVASVNGSQPYIWLPKNVSAIKSFIATKGPVVATVFANEFFMHYGGGVIMATQCTGRFNHYIQVVGYTRMNGIPVWIIKNSWGTRWGVGGYAYLQANVDNPCDLFHQVIAPVVA